MSTDLIEMWHRRVRPHPAAEDFNVQLGCHFEEIIEMLDHTKLVAAHPSQQQALDDDYSKAYELLFCIASDLKHGRAKAEITNRKEFLDAIADQVVTAVGVGHCAGMRVTEAVRRVNTSNWTKFDTDGKPLRDADGKIMKGPNYKTPNLEGLY